MRLQLTGKKLDLQYIYLFIYLFICKKRSHRIVPLPETSSEIHRRPALQQRWILKFKDRVEVVVRNFVDEELHNESASV